MKNNVEITNSQRSVCLTKCHRVLIQKTVDEVLLSEGVAYPCEVAVNIVSDTKIKKLNLQFRQIIKATDVLSFPSGEYPKESEEEFCYLGDIAINLERAKLQSMEYGHSLERELAFLTAHSVLHLLGYDHEDKTEESQMFAKQEQVLDQMGVTR